MNTASNSDEIRQKGEVFINLFMRLRAKGIEDTDIFAALEKTPRYYFVDAQYKSLVLNNCVLPLECGSYIERLDEQLRSIQALNLNAKHRVLEIGTGSGFSAALMALLSLRVTTLERYRILCDRARQNFAVLGRDNIILRHADALQEQESGEAFDRIILWASVEEKPQSFINLLAGNGILIAPVGTADDEQMLMRYVKTGSRFEEKELFPVRYSPMIAGLAAIL